MFCPNCGSPAPENSPFCPICGQAFAANPYQPPHPYPPQPQPYPNPYSQPAPPDHMVWSILVTIFCCQIFGIIAIVNASKVSGAVARGDYATATQASNSAKTWCIAGMICGFTATLLYVGIMVAAEAGV